jgi:uncharacterized protein YndB with AHSA1/START domain
MATLAMAPTPTPASAFPGPIVSQTRVIRAPRARVFEAWTNPEMLKQWFGRAGMYCPSASLDVRVGGAYRIDMQTVPDAAPGETCGRQSSASGVYTKIIPDQLLQFTWTPSFMPAEESLVTVSLKDVEGGTEINIRHERFLPDSVVENYNKGWSGSLDRLAQHLATA